MSRTRKKEMAQVSASARTRIPLSKIASLPRLIHCVKVIMLYETLNGHIKVERWNGANVRSSIYTRASINKNN